MSIVDPDFDMAALDRPPQQFRDIATQQGQIWWLAKFIVAINNVFDDVSATITTLPEGSSPTVDVTFDNDQASFDFKIPVITGEPGQAGTPGADGVGIDDITFNSDYTMTITTTDGETYTSESLRGATGATGATGPAGATGATGATGNGISNIVFNSDYTMTITTTDGNTWTSGSLRGPQGEQGPAGSGGGGVHFATDTNSSSTASRSLTFNENNYSPTDGDIWAIALTSGISATTDYPVFVVNNTSYKLFSMNNRIRHFPVKDASHLFVAVDVTNKNVYPIGIKNNIVPFDYSNTYFAKCSTASNVQNKTLGATGQPLPVAPYYCMFAVCFVNGNTSPTIRFSHLNTGFSDVYYKGVAVSATNPLYLDPNDILILTYTLQSHWEVVSVLHGDAIIDPFDWSTVDITPETGIDLAPVMTGQKGHVAYTQIDVLNQTGNAWAPGVGRSCKLGSIDGFETLTGTAYSAEVDANFILSFPLNNETNTSRDIRVTHCMDNLAISDNEMICTIELWGIPA